jgi:hypothetical protein
MKTAETSSATNGSHHEDQPGQAPAGGRDARGRFTAGNKYGPGNPFARQTAQLRKVLLEVVTPEEMRQVAFTLLLRAKTGNLTAIKLLLQYVLGKPAEGVDPDRLEVEEWRLAQESKVNVADMHDTVQHMPAETANVIVRHAWPPRPTTSASSRTNSTPWTVKTPSAPGRRGRRRPRQTAITVRRTPSPPTPLPRSGAEGRKKSGAGARPGAEATLSRKRRPRRRPWQTAVTARREARPTGGGHRGPERRGGGAPRQTAVTVPGEAAPEEAPGRPGDGFFGCGRASGRR